MARGVTRFGSMREFGGHRTGGGGKFLSKWKEKGQLDVWLHCKELPIAVYRHAMPMIVIKDDRDDRTRKVRHVWSKNFVCHETDKTLEGQYFRDDDGRRKHPPERCGICKLVEWCYQECVEFEGTRELPKKEQRGLRFTTPMFRFEGDDPDETQVLHVGGVCNLFNKDLNDAQKEDLKEARIKLSGPKGAWRENAWAKCQYAMMIVDDAHPDLGVQIAVEACSLGAQVKVRRRGELTNNDNDITKTPYCLRWRYNEKETNLNKKYAVSVVRKKQPSPRILKLIRGEAPDLPDDLTTPFNQQTVRAVLEKHCILPPGVVPWDELFPSKEQSDAWALEDEEAAKSEAEAAAGDEDRAASRGDNDDEDDSSSDVGDDDDEDAPGAASVGKDGGDDDEMVACDACDKPMRASESMCPHCGEEYNVNGAEPPPPKPEPAPLRKRSDKAKAAKGADAPGADKIPF